MYIYNTHWTNLHELTENQFSTVQYYDETNVFKNVLKMCELCPKLVFLFLVCWSRDNLCGNLDLVILVLLL